MTRYVQHNSGKGVKFQVHNETSNRWHCLEFGLPLLLPKSEYVLCEPPEVWKNVTYDIDVQEKGDDCVIAYHNFDPVIWTKSRYRLNKLQLHGYRGEWAFIIEKKENLDATDSR